MMVNNIYVNGVDILGSPVAFDTSLTQTALDIAARITYNTNRFTVTANGAVITITDLPDTGALHNNQQVTVNVSGNMVATATPLAGGVDAIVTSPEIHPSHHRYLIKWAMHRAYEMPDAEVFNPDKCAKALAEFEAYFGVRPDAQLRKDNNSSKPHRNVAYF